MGLQSYYIRRIIFLNIFIQFCLFISFSTIQAPSILMTISGLNIGKTNILILILLSVLEWSNLLILLSLIFSIIWIIYSDFIVKDVQMLFLQLGRSSRDLFKCLFFPCFCFATFFVLNSVFLRPKVNFLLRKHLLNTVKKSAFYMIEPSKVLRMHAINALSDVNLSLAYREENNLYGLLVHKESLDIIAMVHKFNFENNDLLDINMDKVFLILDRLKLNVKCDKIFVSINPDKINFAKHISIFENFTFKVLFDLFKIFIITLFLSLWIYIIILVKDFYIKCYITIGYIIGLLNAVNLIYFNEVFFITVLIIILADFIKVRRCSSF